MIERLPSTPNFYSSPAALTIETANLADLDDLIDFLQPIFADTYSNSSEHDDITREMFEGEAFRNYLRYGYLGKKLVDPQSTLLVSREDGRIVGTIGIALPEPGADTAEIWGFYVAKELQGKGVGRLLWATLIGREVSASVKTLFLYVVKGSSKAIAFYERNRFKISGEEEWSWPCCTSEPLVNQFWIMQKECEPGEHLHSHSNPNTP